MEQTIIAQATAPVKAALAVLRVSGENAISITEKCFSGSLSDISSKTIKVGYLIDKNKRNIDQVVLLIYPGPKSYTGENVVEIICHGSQLIVEEIISLYISNGARLAKRGEFTERAFLNNKMDLVEGESVNDLINAATKEAKDIALRSLDGQASKLIKPIEKKIEDLLGMIEVNIDFPEFKDVEEATPITIKNSVEEIIKTIDNLIQSGLEGKVIKDGINVAIVGDPNVGKSSILNALLNENKAIVTNIPGTTRDIVEGVININGIPVRLLDTAGVRETTDVVEKIGVELSTDAIEKADLIVYVLDSSNPIKNELIEKHISNKKVIYCFNKSDLISKKDTNKIYSNAASKDIKDLKEAIYNSLHLSEDAFDKPSLTNERQISLLNGVKTDLLESVNAIDSGFGVDVIAISIQSAYLKLKEILGEVVTVDLEDAIFSNFCVGK